MALKAYSLWLMPGKETTVQERVHREIKHWASRGAGPEFLPHVTLLGGFESTEEQVLERAEALAAQLKERTVMDTHRKCCQVFGVDATTYNPHCSLIYSDMSQEERRSAVEESRQRMYGDMQGYNNLLWETGFWAEALHVWETDGSDKSTASWREIAQFALPKESQS